MEGSKRSWHATLPLPIANPEQPTSIADDTERYHATAHSRGNHEGVSYGI